MKKIPLVILMLVSISVYSSDEKINYMLVTDVKAKRMGEYVVRYLRTLQGACMGHVQSLVSDKNKNWSIYQSKTLCKIDGKFTETDFADATITKLEFKENSIHMVISTTELRPTGEYLRRCTIKVNKGRLSAMHCSKPVYAKDFEF